MIALRAHEEEEKNFRKRPDNVGAFVVDDLFGLRVAKVNLSLTLQRVLFSSKSKQAPEP
jgi:hypothetical protein